MRHKARAVVFTDIEDLHKRIDDPKLDVREDDIVLQNCGPKGYPGRKSATSRCRRSS
jgi:dihydroxy-acid dehydratase